LYNRFEKFTTIADSIADRFYEARFYNNFQISDLISSCNKIISTYTHIIKIEDIHFVKVVHAADLLRFAQEARYYRLLSERNYLEIEKHYSGYITNHSQIFDIP